MPGVDPSVELQDLCFKLAEQRTQGFETRTRDLGNAVVPLICNGVEQFLHAVATTMPNSARRARMVLMIAVCCRMKRFRFRFSIRQLCCSGVLVGTKRMLGRWTASQIASASA